MVPRRGAYTPVSGQSSKPEADAVEDADEHVILPHQSESLGSDGIRCPHCGNGKIQKASAIVSSGSWQQATAMYAPSNRQGQEQFAFGVSEGSTALARLLAPPAPPMGMIDTRIKWMVASVFCWFALICLPLAVVGDALHPIINATLTPDDGYSAFWQAMLQVKWIELVGVLPLLLVVHWGTKRIRFWWDSQNPPITLHDPTLPVRQAQHRETLARWQHIWYCSQCDTVIDVQSGRSASSAQMHTLL